MRGAVVPSRGGSTLPIDQVFNHDSMHDVVDLILLGCIEDADTHTPLQKHSQRDCWVRLLTYNPCFPPNDIFYNPSLALESKRSDKRHTCDTMSDELFLSTCFDSIEETNGHDQAQEWFPRVLNAVTDLARFVAHRRGRGRAIKVVGFLRGSFNVGFQFKFEDDGPDAIIRFPKPGHISAALLEEKLINEVRTMEYIREKTTIPLPFVRGWGLANECPQQLGPFIIMDFVQGTRASTILRELSEDDQLSSTSNPDLEGSGLDKFYRQVAGYLLQLSQLEFDRVGAICKGEPGEDAWSSSKRPLTYNMNELATCAGYPTDRFPITSFARARDFFYHVADAHLTHLHTQRNLADSPEVARARYIARHRYLQLVDKYCCDEDDRGPFIPFCDDFRPGNMLMDPDTMEITAVVDWEFTNAMPVQFSHDPPWWLLGADPGCYVDDNEVQEFRRRYEPRMEQFLRSLEAVEAEGRGRGWGDRRLSARMRRSWQTGQFWFNFASRKSYDVDAIYWRALHDGGDAAELLDPAVRAEMEAVVETKMTQLREYREECAVRPLEEEVDVSPTG